MHEASLQADLTQFTNELNSTQSTQFITNSTQFVSPIHYVATFPSGAQLEPYVYLARLLHREEMLH